MTNSKIPLTIISLTVLIIMFVGICVLCAYSGNQVDTTTFITQFE